MEKSLMQIIEGACDKFCKEYCKYSEAFKNDEYSEEDAMEICAICPINELT